ncbi:EXS-domain-containing protein, partial [Epithele typhae]|uniref:EXS-domain-containing protein n=1 Tax=Epithele typhae TaxID=378194 RepID=UPI002008433B
IHRSSRWWLVRNTGKLLTAGWRRVEFADFWLGDQFCSLTFTLGNLYFLACVYTTAGGLDDSWRRCTSGPGPGWGAAFALAALPLVVRLVQSVKRYADSGLDTHLINAGKYGAGVAASLFYYLWRAHGGLHGPYFVAWCVFATVNSLYAGAWDLLMDWSLLRPRARYFLLRPDLLYTNNISFYYFAIVTNSLLRFMWVMYIPEQGPNSIIRSFVAGFLEVLRRWQWNFLRLENEHLGNIDQYRVTREVPLPYTYEDHSHESDGDEDDAGSQRSRVGWKMKRRAQSARGETEVEAAAAGRD